MTLKAVLICQSGGTAYSSKVKAAFSFFDEIFHSASAAIRPEYLIRFHFQCCDMNVNFRFFYTLSVSDE